MNQDDKWSPIFQSASALLEQMVRDKLFQRLCLVIMTDVVYTLNTTELTAVHTITLEISLANNVNTV